MKVYEGNSFQKQLYLNTKDIEKLKQELQPWYSCEGDLGTDSISITKALTNVKDEEVGFLIDSAGHLYKINANDGESLLLEYYSTIVGAKGDKGDNGSDSLVTLENITINKNNFVESTVYEAYPYQYVLYDSNLIVGTVRCGMLLFNVNEANSGNYASVCDVNENAHTITIYSKVIPEESFVIPQIWLIKA